MTEDIKPEVLKRTQDSLKKYVKKPPLTEKLLRKPPFRFLHDLITSIMRETGFLQGLYSLEELNPDNIKDRDGKIAFLEKLILAIKLATGASINARPTKIVAGLEVERTNELLQIIGKALEKKIDSSKAVEQVLNKGNKKPNTKSNKETSKHKSSKEIIGEENKSKDKSENDKKKKPPSRSNKDNAVKEAAPKLKQSSKKEKENTVSTRKKEKSPTKPVTETQRKVKGTTNRDVVIKEPLEDQKQVQPPDSENNKLGIDDSPVPLNNVQENRQTEKEIKKENSFELSNNNLIDKKEDDSTPENKNEEEIVKPIAQDEESINNEVDKKTADDIKQDDEVQNKEATKKEETVKMKRPSSAHPGHRRQSSTRQIAEADIGSDNKNADQPGDKISDNPPEEVLVLGASSSISSDVSAVKASPPLVSRPRTAARPPSARPGAPRVRDRGHVEVVEDVRSPSVPVNLIVDADSNKDEDDENLVVLEPQATSSEAQVEQPKADLTSDSSTGGLDLSGQEQGHLVAQILETQRELELSGASSAKVEIEWEGGRKRERESALKEVDRLRGAIQSLTRAANPLGKLIDFLQEDVDSMQREFINWQQTNSRLVKELQSEQSLTEASLEPMKRQLDELDALIHDELEKVSTVKANIIRNDERILKLLPGVHNS